MIFAGNAGDFITCQELIQRGADVNAQTNEGLTALMAACEIGRPECVELLLRSGANYQIQNREGKTALAIALEKNNTSCRDLILQIIMAKFKWGP